MKIQEAIANAALANVRQAQARVDQAQLNLGYTKITAPATGIVNKKNVQVGANLSVGQDLLTIIPLTNLWVTANFKETQLDRMRAGQPVTIRVDALGGRKFSGKVTQIGGATGSRLSLVPAGERDRQLCEGGTTYSCADRLHQSAGGGLRYGAAARVLGDAGGNGEVAVIALIN